MQPFDSEFQENPFNFASTHPLTPVGGASGNYRQKNDSNGTPFTLYQVGGEDRVAFAEIIKNPGTSDHFSLLITATQTQAHQFPIFWLPYEVNHTTRCTLSVSKKNPKKDLAENVVDPNYFVTIALTGCTVSVAGDPTQPTVYHSGQPTQQPGDDDPEEDTEVGRNALTERYLDGIIQRSEASFPKYPSQQPHLKHLFPSQYGRSIVDPQAREERETAIISSHILVKGKVGFTDGATVIGSRSPEDGTWQFYCQEWSEIKFERKFGWDCNKRIVRQMYKFWPGNTEVKPGQIHVFPKNMK